MLGNFILRADRQEHALYGTGMLHNRYTIEAVAHSLAQTNRFVGHADRPYSVAEHSLLCADIAEEMEQPARIVLACLLHDGHESATGDTSSPGKHAIGEGWRRFEGEHATAFRRQFGIGAFFAAGSIVHRIDLIALATERRDVTPWDPAIHSPWPCLDTPGREVPPWDGVALNTAWRTQMAWTEWRDRFVERFEALCVQRDKEMRQMVRHTPA